MPAEIAAAPLATPPADAPRRARAVLPALILSAALGLLLCSLANRLGRAAEPGAIPLYWAGILVITLPIFYRLTSRDAAAGERLALVCLLGLALYAVKVVRDAPIFTFSDELIHAFNANQVAVHERLFNANPVLEVTRSYPGLEGATSALMKLTGASSFTAGVILVGAARVTLMGALFLLFRAVSGSARIAGIGAALYAGNFNFLFWGAQFSYESLALPLLVVVLLLIAEREAAPAPRRRDWLLPLCLGIGAIVVTHHLTSYVLVVVLAALAVAFRLARGSWAPPNPWAIAAGAALASLIWLFAVAATTIDYLSTPLGGALEAVGQAISGEAPARAVFQSDSIAGPTPLVAQLIAVAAVALLVVALPIGLRRLWRAERGNPFALVFAAASLCFLAGLLLRLTSASWEVGNRASEFLFIGLAFVLACTGLQDWRPASSRLAGRLGASAALGLVLVGGAIAGWPWDSQLARPLRIEADERTIVSPPLAAAEWAGREVRGGRFAAATADAGLLLDRAGKTVLSGPDPNVEDTLTEPELQPWQLRMLRENDLRYVVADRRRASSDGLRGYYFSLRGEEQLLPEGVVTKFARIPGAAPIYSNGAITVYDLEAGR